MAKVSQVPTITLWRKAVDVSGGKNSATKRPMLRRASIDRNCRHWRSSDQKLATTSARMPVVNQQAVQRALNSGGGNL